MQLPWQERLMTDQISLKGIRGFGYHGVFDDEKENGQDFFVDVLITIDLAPSVQSDELSHTIDYSVSSGYGFSSRDR
jgi:dihydroneopterin aldolase